MPEIISPARQVRTGGPGLSYFLSTKLLGQPLAMRQSEALRLKQAIDARAFDSGVEVSVGPGANKFAGTYDARSRFRVTDDGIAIVPVQGMLLDRGAWLGDLGGFATTYEGLSEQLQRIAKDNAIKTVVFDIDSGGGMVAGLDDLTSEIVKLGKSKRTVAIAANMADSAAYAIACSASETFVTRSGEAGSIGVIWVHTSYARMLDSAGVDTTMIFEGDHKVDGNPYQPLSHGARAEMSAALADCNQMFVAHVAKQRSLDEAAVRAMQARVFVGAKAVSAGLADGVKSFEEVLEHVRKGKSPTGAAPKKGGRTVSDNNAPAAGRSDIETIIGAVVAGLNARPAVAAVVAPSAAPAAAAPAAAPAAVDDTARVFAILECDEAKDRPSLARTLAKQGLSIDAAKEILAAAAVEKPAADQSPLGGALASRMAQPGAAAGVKPDAAAAGGAQRPSLATTFEKRFNPKKGA